MTALTHFVYYIWDADDWPLYIGCSSNPEKRLRYHLTKSFWHKRCTVARTEISGPFDKDLALRIEAEEIARWGPAHNVRDNYAFNLARNEWWDAFYAEWEVERYRSGCMSYADLLQKRHRDFPHPGQPPSEEFIAELLHGVAA